MRPAPSCLKGRSPQGEWGEPPGSCRGPASIGSSALPATPPTLGCRYGELIALRAADYNADAGTITVRESKAGKVRHVVLTDEGRTLFDALTAGRKGDTRILLRSDGKPWGASHQQRPLAEACARARISPAVSFHILRDAHGSTLAMRGVPMGVIAAQLGHSSTRE